MKRMCLKHVKATLETPSLKIVAFLTNNFENNHSLIDDKTIHVVITYIYDPS